MGSLYLKNHLGGQLTDAEYEDIPYPTCELVSHVTMKTVQAGALLGSCIFAPVAVLLRAPKKDIAALSQRSLRYGRNGIIIGLVAGPLMTYLKIKNDPVEKITDRDFRLRHNRDQIRVDQGAIVGGLMGTGVNAMMRRPPMLGATLGISAGVLGMAVYNNNIKKK